MVVVLLGLALLTAFFVHRAGGALLGLLFGDAPVFIRIFMCSYCRSRLLPFSTSAAYGTSIRFAKTLNRVSPFY